LIKHFDKRQLGFELQELLSRKALRHSKTVGLVETE